MCISPLSKKGDPLGGEGHPTEKKVPKEESLRFHLGENIKNLFVIICGNLGKMQD